MCEVGAMSTVAITSATSRAAIGDVRPEPNGSRIVSVLAVDEAAIVMKMGVSRNMGGLMCTTGRPDHSSTCSQSQCCRCWADSVVLGSVIWETVICDMLTSTGTFPYSRAAE